MLKSECTYRVIVSLVVPVVWLLHPNSLLHAIMVLKVSQVGADRLSFTSNSFLNCNSFSNVGVQERAQQGLNAYMSTTCTELMRIIINSSVYIQRNLV